MPDKKAETVAEFIYCNIYCRYLAPGECVIWDQGGEFCNQVCQALLGSFGVEIRVIAGGRPQSNGIAEAQVKNMKRKMKTLILDKDGKTYPHDWDQTLFHNALQILRSDPAGAHGFAPGELILGRQMKFPIQFENEEIDFEGTSLTLPLVQSLKGIHDQNFKTASKKIKKHQARYKKSYDKKHKVKAFNLKVGDKVQYRRKTSKFTLSKKNFIKWAPVGEYHLILKIFPERKRVQLQDINGNVLKRLQSMDNLRKYKGKS